MTTATLGDSGIVLGGDVDEHGVQWRWNAGSDPWSPGPVPREVSGAMGSAHGSWNATAFYEHRTQELEVGVWAPSHAALHHARQRWMDAIDLRPFAFIVDEPFFGRRQAQMRRAGAPTWREETPGGERGGAFAHATASLRGDDPLIYATATKTVSTGFPSSTGGLSWPAVWPATWDAVVESGLLRTVSDGSQPSPAVWRIDGPVVDPIVTRVGDGARFRLAMDLSAGQWVTVDTSTQMVLASGDVQASRRAQWSGVWLDVPPGAAEFTFAGAAGGLGAQLTVTWQDAWI